MEAGVQQGGGKLREKSFHYLLEMGRLFFSLGLGQCNPNGPHSFCRLWIHSSALRQTPIQ